MASVMKIIPNTWLCQIEEADLSHLELLFLKAQVFKPFCVQQSDTKEVPLASWLYLSILQAVVQPVDFISYSAGAFCSQYIPAECIGKELVKTRQVPEPETACVQVCQ